MIRSKKQSMIIIGAFVIILMLFTTTYAFFNYTRTGTANTIRTGRISFNTTQSNTLNLTNVFPMSEVDAENANLDAVSIRIWGDTTYTDGEEFEISIVDVNNTIGSGQSAKTIPINYIASYSATPVQSGDPNVIGTNSDSYFTVRGQSSPVYLLKTTGEATNGEQVLIGFIPSGAKGIDGTLTIKAYLDSSKIAISDTYNDGNTPTDNMGTPTSFGEGRTVLTTTEWNSLQNTETPLSFKIKAVSQEGIWIEEPTVPTAAEYLLTNVQTLETTPYGKIYTGANPNNYVIFNNEQWRIIGVYGDKLKIISTTPINGHEYDSTNSNVWETSTLSTYLNQEFDGGYYYSLDITAKQMITDGVWNSGGVTGEENASEAYANATQTSVIKKVGLISSYEYLYAAENNGICWTTAGNVYDSNCVDNDWIKGPLWTISPNIDHPGFALSINNSGGVIRNGWYNSHVAYQIPILPVVYLKPEVTIFGGTGESGGNEYILNYAAS